MIFQHYSYFIFIIHFLIILPITTFAQWSSTSSTSSNSNTLLNRNNLTNYDNFSTQYGTQQNQQQDQNINPQQNPQDDNRLFGDQNYFGRTTKTPDYFGRTTKTPDYPRRTYQYSTNHYDDSVSGKIGSRFSSSSSKNSIFKQPTYFIVASKMVRPGLIYQISVSVLQALYPITVHASISRDGVEVSGDSKEVKEGIPETLMMRIPPTSAIGDYKLRVEGLYNNILGGIAFLNETALTFSQRSLTIFIQTDKPVYMQGETIHFRTIPLTTELKGYNGAMDVYMLDPNQHLIRRWLSRQSNLGSVSLDYKLSDQPPYGRWTIRVVVQGQVEEGHFLVEEFYQTRFEVNVTMPAFFFNTDPFIHGKIMANFTSGGPARGNLTLKAIIRPIGWFNTMDMNKQYRVDYQQGFNNLHNNYNSYDQYNQRNQYNQYNQYNTYNENNQNRGNLGGNLGNVDQSYNTNSYDQYFIEKYYNFEEAWPFWIDKPIGNQVYDHQSGSVKYTLPFLRFFNGTFDFKYPMNELESLVPNVANVEVMIVASVGEKFYDEVVTGYAIARIYNSSIKVNFMGESPQVFKPDMPFTLYLIVQYHDGSPITFGRNQGVMEVNGYVEGRSKGRRDYATRSLQMSKDEGIWELKIDLRSDLGVYDDREINNFLKDIQSMKLHATYTDMRGERTETDLLLLAHYSPLHHYIHVSTSTNQAKVGEYIIFHIRSNFFIETFNYLILSKGIVLNTGEETIHEGIRSMAVTLSSEMAPVATIVVWKITQRGQVVADSLTFPVNGISRNNFTVYINNRKARTGEKVEVAIYGEPGTYVALSGIDNAFYTMQAGNELTYAGVITKMANFGEPTKMEMYKKHTWYSHEGKPDKLVYYPTSSFGIDANRTFEFANLIVFTDANIPQRGENCNETLGYKECLSGQCYRIEKRCDGFFDCDDGTDEANCFPRNDTFISEFRKYRFNRIKRHYENVWLWKDCNIGPHGRYIFNVEVPDVPALWMVSAFSISPSKGFGMLGNAIEYVGVRPFLINIEMPKECRQGEQVGIRVTVFNYMTTPIEATVVLHGSPDYKFVHVEEDGIVRSYNPKTSFGEHQFFVFLESQESNVVYIPIVPTRLGDIDITIHAGTLLGTDQITRRIHVESDGLPQYRHQSILLDLSNRAYVFQYMHVNVTETPVIPYQVERYFVYGSNKARVSVVGDVVGPIFPTMPVNSSTLLFLPMESAEQNMFSFAANLYTIMYMRLINQRNKVTEKNAFYHMNVLYQRQMSYLKEDGSFSLFRSDWNNSASSVWLTAYCTRVFQEASFYEWENYIFIDPTIIQKNIQWILSHQTPEGAFYEVTWYPDRKMNGTLKFENLALKQRNISLTAHVLITLATVKDLSGDLGARVALAQQRAINWIERNMRLLKETKEPYDVAIVAYALTLARAANAEHVFGILRGHVRSVGEYMFWGNIDVPLPPSKIENQKYFSLPRLPYEYDSLNIETTAYALLVYVSRREFFIDPIVRWLNAQRLNDGGWASTQDTSVALKALIEYTVYSRIREVSSLSISVEATSLPGQTKTFYINDNNLAQLQHIEFPNAWGTVKVQAKGAGFAILQMHVQYNVDIEKYQTKPPVPAFDLYTRAMFHGRNQSHISYLCCQKWINYEESPRSGLSVLDVTIPTGYFIQQQKLDSYVLSRRVRNLQRALYMEKKVVFYFEFLDDENICVNFTVERWYPVANMSRYLPIKVYDYYAPERFNETIFDALPTYLLNICEVCGSSQCPYCTIYNSGYKVTASIVLLVFVRLIFYLRNS